MDSDNALNVQNGFFNQMRKDHLKVTVLMTNGQRLSGFVKSFDRFTLLLDTKNGEQIIFKHAIATVGPHRTPEPKEGGSRRPGDEKARPEKGFGNYIDFGEERK